MVLRDVALNPIRVRLLAEGADMIPTSVMINANVLSSSQM